MHNRQQMALPQETVGVMGLGYVGLPVALAFAKKFPTIGFDISLARVDALKNGVDTTNEVSSRDLADSSIVLTTDMEKIGECSFIIVAVPTPIDGDNKPDLTPLIQSSTTVAQHLPKGSVVVYESTVFPGATEDICVPILERISQGTCGTDFFVGYSPERINPGDKQHTFDRIVKVVSGDSKETLERVATMYEQVVTVGVHRAPSIKVAEAAKVIENTQRDLNIALMNELSLIFDRLDIRTKDVLAASGTKWNFLPFTPGLVGGHCIGVDPYYLTTKAQEVGYEPEVILAGRRINDGMGRFIARKTLTLLKDNNIATANAKIGIGGLTFKENVPDLRNSRVPDIVAELRDFGIEPLVHDPQGSPEVALREYNIRLSPWEELVGLDALIITVPHTFYCEMPADQLLQRVKINGAVVDVKSILCPKDIPDTMLYWSL